jgi:HEAT repeat protein
LLDNAHSHIRWHATMILGQRGDESALPKLEDRIQHDPDEGVRSAAADAARLIMAR